MIADVSVIQTGEMDDDINHVDSDCVEDCNYHVAIDPIDETDQFPF